MKDLKFMKELSGWGGSDCIICESRKGYWKKYWQNIRGFSHHLLCHKLTDLYEEPIQEDGEIQKKQGDYHNHKALTQKPLTSSEQLSICILHSYMNVFSWLLKVLYH